MKLELRELHHKFIHFSLFYGKKKEQKNFDLHLLIATCYYRIRDNYRGIEKGGFGRNTAR